MSYNTIVEAEKKKKKNEVQGYGPLVPPTFSISKQKDQLRWSLSASISLQRKPTKSYFFWKR